MKKPPWTNCFQSIQGENYASVGSVGRSAVPVNLIMTYGIAVLPAAIAGVTLHGVDKAVLHLFHDTHMVGKAVLGAGAALVVPIKVDDVAGAGFIAVVLPESPVFEPIRAGNTARRPGDHASVQIPALVGAPTDKTGAPLHTGIEAVP